MKFDAAAITAFAAQAAERAAPAAAWFLPAPRWFRRLVFALCAVGAYPYFLVTTFPSSVLVDRLSTAAAEQGFPFAAQHAALSLPAGLVLDGVTLTNLKIASRADEEPQPAKLDRVELSAGIVDLVFAAIGRPGGSVDMKLWGGRMSMWARKGTGGALAVRTDIANVALDPWAHLNPQIPKFVFLEGTLSGNADLTWNADKPEASKGDAVLTFKNAAVAETTEPVPFPRLDFGTLVMRSRVDAGVLRIVEFKSSGGNVGLEALGTIALAKEPDNMRLSMLIRIDVPDELVATVRKEPLGSMALSNLGFTRAKGVDGKYYYRMSGSLRFPSGLANSNGADEWNRMVEEAAKPAPAAAEKEGK